MSELSDNTRSEEVGETAVGAVAMRSESGGGRSRRRLVLLLLLASLLAAVVALDMYYLVTRRPLTELLPPAVAVAKALPPTYVTSFYGVNTPAGVAVSPDSQRVYVSESDGDRMVRAFDRAGMELFSFNAPNVGPMGWSPVYLAADPKGQIYVADRMRRLVSVFGPDGRFSADVKSPDSAPLGAPIGVSFDRSGNLLIADATKDDHKIVILGPDGTFKSRIGAFGGGPGQFLFPNQAAVDSRGRMFVSNGNAVRVDLFDAAGNYLGPLATGNAKGAVGTPRGIVVDSQDRLYIVDGVGCAVQVFDVSGDKPAYLFSFGDSGEGDGQMQFPIGIAVDSTGRIYVADSGNSRLQVWSY